MACRNRIQGVGSVGWRLIAVAALLIAAGAGLAVSHSDDAGAADGARKSDLQGNPVIATAGAAAEAPVEAGPSQSKEKVDMSQTAHSVPGRNEWNLGREPKDWWAEVERYHGHVGPWNVMGWRIARAAMRELGAEWGDHTLDVVCAVPPAMPFTCLADGLTVGTGNSIGRLDIRLAEVVSPGLIHVGVRRKDGTGPVLVFRPHAAYLEKIRTRPKEELHDLAHECAETPESELFVIERQEAGQ